MKASAGKHVLFLVENASVPEDLRVWKEAKSVKHLGYDVTVISPRGVNIDGEKHIVLEGVDVYRYPPLVIGSGFLSYILEYLNALWMSGWLVFRVNLRKRIHIFHVANPPDIFFPIIVLYKLFGAKYIFDVHDLFVNTFESKYQDNHSPVKKLIVGMLRIVERMNILCADRLVVTNQSYREYVLEHHGWNAEKVFIVRNAPPLDDRAGVASDPSFKKGKSHMLVYFGVMGEDDGVDVVLSAVHHMVATRAFTDFVCYLIGPTEIERSSAIVKLRQMHKELGLNSHVFFTGHLPWRLVHQYLNTADIGLSPDLYTPQNNLSTMIKIMEYMSHGLPIVSFNLKENRFSAGEAAVYCGAYQAEELGDTIIALLNDASRRKAMTSVGLARYAGDFNWSSSEKNLSAVYASLQEGTL